MVSVVATVVGWLAKGESEREKEREREKGCTRGVSKDQVHPFDAAAASYRNRKQKIKKKKKRKRVAYVEMFAKCVYACRYRHWVAT